MARTGARRTAATPVEGIAWTTVAGETLSARVTAQIRAALFSGQIKAGDRLGSENELAARFGVSRMAVRDALRSLAATGIVDVRVGAKGGIFIAEGNPEHFADALAIQLTLIGLTLEELFDAQIAIEVTSAELAAARATAADVAGLRALVAELQALAAQFKALRFVLEPVYATGTTNEIVGRVIASHKALLACLEKRDAAGARAHMQRRLQHIRAHHLGAGAGKNGRRQPPITRAANE